MAANLAALLDRPAAPPTTKPTAGYEDEASAVERLVQWFEDAEDATTESRRRSEQARDYYDGEQLTAAERKVLRDRGQPDIIINRIQPKINYLIGYEASNRTDPKGVPRTPNDEEAAGAATDGLRYVKDKTELEQHFSAIWEHMLIEGYGALELQVVENAEGKDPEFEVVRWDWDRLFYDPHSRRPDFSDARYLGGVVWLDLEDAKQRWPESAGVFDKTWSDESSSSTYEDRPAHMQWTQRGSRKRVRVVQMYYQEANIWHFCVFTKGGKLQSFQVPFVDQDGKSWCPMIFQSAFVDRKNRRYGLVHCMIGVQDEINKRRSKSLHRITMRQVQAERGAVDDVEMAKRELAKPDGYLETNPGFAFNLLDNSAQFQGEINLLQHAQQEIELMGPNAALLGKDENAPSGRAIAMNQNSGQTEIGVLVDRLLNCKKRTYQRIWDLIRQYKTQEWWVRVTDNEDNVKFVGFNRPVTMGEALQKRALKSGMPPEMVQVKMAELQANPAIAAQLEQVAENENVPAQMYMDITIEQMPSVANVQQEQFDALVALAPAVTFPPEVYLMASTLRNKRELLEKLKGPAADPVAVEAQKIQLEQSIKKTEAEIDKLRAEAAKTYVEADMASLPMGQVEIPVINKANTGDEPASESVPPPGSTGANENVPPTMTGEMRAE